MSDKKSIDVQIDYHQSGRLTLKEKQQGENKWVDVKESGLLANSNAASFYQKVASRLATYAQSGIINYR
jgi:hypothetical protein